MKRFLFLLIFGLHLGLLLVEAQPAQNVKSKKKPIVTPVSTKSVSIESYGADLFFKAFYGSLSISPNTDGTSTITYQGSQDVFTQQFVGKDFKSAPIHQNTSDFPETDNYWPGLITVRFAKVTKVINGKTLVVNFAYNGGDCKNPKVTKNTDGWFFVNNVEAYKKALEDTLRPTIITQPANTDLCIIGYPGAVIKKGFVYKSDSKTNVNPRIRFMFDDAFTISKEGNSGNKTFNTRFKSTFCHKLTQKDDSCIYNNVDIVPTQYVVAGVQSLPPIVFWYDDNPKSATARKCAIKNSNIYVARDEMKAALNGQLRPRATVFCGTYAYSLTGGKHNGKDITHYAIYELKNTSWHGDMNLKSKKVAGVLFRLRGKSATERLNFIEPASLKVDRLNQVDLVFGGDKNNRQVTITSNHTWYQLANQYWTGGTSAGAYNLNKRQRILVDGWELYHHNNGDWWIEENAKGNYRGILNAKQAVIFDRIPKKGDVISPKKVSGDVLEIWGWGVQKGDELVANGTSYIILEKTYKQYAGEQFGFYHLWEVKLSKAVPANVKDFKVAKSQTEYLLDGKPRKADLVYGEKLGHLVYTDQEVNMDWENVNFSGYFRATGEYDGSNDLYKMTSIARFANCFAVNEDLTPAVEYGNEWNPVSLRKRHELTGNNNYRVFIHGGRMYWNRVNLSFPEVVFTGRPTFIYGTASYGEPRILNPVFADNLGATIGKAGATFAFSHGHRVNLSNFKLEGPLQLSGKAEVLIDNMQTSALPESPGEFYGISINNDLPAQQAQKIDDRNLVLIGKGGAVGIRVVGDAYNDNNLSITLTDWNLKPSPFNKTGFTGNKKGAGKSKISINGAKQQL